MLPFGRPAFDPRRANPFPKPLPDRIKRSATTAAQRNYAQSDSGAPVVGGAPRDVYTVRAYPTIKTQKKMKTHFIDPRNPSIWLHRQQQEMIKKGINPRDKRYST